MELIRYSNGQGEGLRLDRDEALALVQALPLALRFGQYEIKLKESSWEIGIEILED